MHWDRALVRLAGYYAESPLEFGCENDIQARLYDEYRSVLDQQNQLELTLGKGFTIHVADDNQPSYANKYHNLLEESVRQGSFLNRIRTELTVWHPLSDMISDERPLDKDDVGSEVLDLAILRSPMDRPIHLENGRYRVEIEMVEAAVEIKYPRSHTVIPATTRESLDGFTDDDLKAIVDLDRLGVKDDIEELEALGSEYTIDTYFLFCSQYDILRRGTRTSTRHQRLADAAVDVLKEACKETSILYAYPGNWEWIIQN